MAIEFNRDFNIGLRDEKAKYVVKNLEAKYGHPVHFESSPNGCYVTVPPSYADTIKAALRECGGRFIYSQEIEGKLRVKFNPLVGGAES